MKIGSSNLGWLHQRYDVLEHLLSTVVAQLKLFSHSHLHHAHEPWQAQPVREFNQGYTIHSRVQATVGASAERAWGLSSIQVLLHSAEGFRIDA